jgi:hypothetical protein
VHAREDLARRGLLEYTFSGPFTVALLVVGPFWLALLAQSVALLVDDLRRRKKLVKVLFNLSQYAISITAASASSPP